MDRWRESALASTWPPVHDRTHKQSRTAWVDLRSFDHLRHIVRREHRSPRGFLAVLVSPRASTFAGIAELKDRTALADLADDPDRAPSEIGIDGFGIFDFEAPSIIGIEPAAFHI